MGDLKRCPQCGSRCGMWVTLHGSLDCTEGPPYRVECIHTVFGMCDYAAPDADTKAEARKHHDASVAEARGK